MGSKRTFSPIGPTRQLKCISKLCMRSREAVACQDQPVPARSRCERLPPLFSKEVTTRSCLQSRLKPSSTPYSNEERGQIGLCLIARGIF